MLELVSVISMCAACRPGVSAYAFLTNGNSQVIIIQSCFHEKNGFTRRQPRASVTVALENCRLVYTI